MSVFQYVSQYMIHFQGAVYANELYDSKGRNVYTLEDAIAAAEKFHGKDGWEVYNGQDGSECRFITQ